MLALVSSWFTPTSLFLFLNLVIGTIAVTARLSSHNRQAPHQPPEHHHRRLARAPSLLERVTSIDLYCYKFSPFHSEPGIQTATAEDLAHSAQSEYTATTHDPPPQLERAPSLLERVKSIKFSSFYRSEQETELAAPTDTDPFPADSGAAEHHVKRSKSESRVAPKKHAQEKMKKSVSEKAVVAVAAEDEEEREEEEEEDPEKVERRRPATARIEKTVSFGEEGVDAKADDFINKFKQQLRLQRLDSLLRYNEMLKGKKT